MLRNDNQIWQVEIKNSFPLVCHSPALTRPFSHFVANSETNSHKNNLITETCSGRRRLKTDFAQLQQLQLRMQQRDDGLVLVQIM